MSLNSIEMFVVTKFGLSYTFEKSFRNFWHQRSEYLKSKQAQCIDSWQNDKLSIRMYQTSDTIDIVLGQTF